MSVEAYSALEKRSVTSTIRCVLPFQNISTDKRWMYLEDFHDVLYRLAARML